VQSGLKFVADAKTPGCLYSLPGKDYPAATFTPVSTYVHGELYRMTDSDAHEWLDDIDIEEEVDEGLYARVLRKVVTDKETFDAWVYTYLQPVDEAFEIRTGVFPAPLHASTPGGQRSVPTEEQSETDTARRRP
jgi:gamma-glutamylcyclotransferase (GGCT)/AIG2-like uncharacterized protein YtfP